MSDKPKDDPNPKVDPKVDPKVEMPKMAKAEMFSADDTEALPEDVQGGPGGLGRSDQPVPDSEDLTAGPGGDVTLSHIIPNWKLY